MQRILVYLSTTGEKISRASLEVLSYCREVAEQSGAELAAMVAHPDPEQFVETMGTYGARRIFLVRDPVFSSPMNASLIAALERVVGEYEPELIACASSEAVKDILGAAAVRLGAAVLPDVVSFEIKGETVEAHRPVQAANYLAHAEAQGKRFLISLLPGVAEATAKPVTSEVVSVPLNFDRNTLRFKVEETSQVAAGTIDLSDAEVVVAAGRGVKDSVGKEMVVTLANCLGGAVGATRAVVETGLFPASAQIGQTGKVVAPQLYIGVGISGAIQHVAGIRDSRVIVAINKDSESPIFEIATYGIVGDLYEVLSLLIEQIKPFTRTE